MVPRFLRSVVEALPRCAVALLVLSAALAACSSPAGAPKPTTTPAGPQANGARSIRIVSSTVPAVLTPREGGRVYHIMTRVTGVALYAAGIGRPPKDGQGHIQAYLDRLPGGAYSKVDLRFPWLFQVASPAVNFRLPTAVAHAKPGPHRLLLALAKNNGVLFRGVKAAVVKFRLR